MPLAPDLAVRITPDLGFTPDTKPRFDRLSLRYVEPSRHTVVTLNETIVRAAEDLVFYRDDEPWVARFLEGSAPYGILSRVAENREERGRMVAARMEVGKRD